MFKFYLIILIIIIIIIIKLGISSFYKLHIYKEIIKYPFNNSDTSFFQKWCINSELKNVNSNCIFYQDYLWSTKNNNYIYDNHLDKYYIIDRGYYYYIPYIKRYTLHIKSNKKIKLINNMNKVVIL